MGLDPPVSQTALTSQDRFGLQRNALTARHQGYKYGKSGGYLAHPVTLPARHDGLASRSTRNSPCRQNGQAQSGPPAITGTWPTSSQKSQGAGPKGRGLPHAMQSPFLSATISAESHAEQVSRSVPTRGGARSISTIGPPVASRSAILSPRAATILASPSLASAWRAAPASPASISEATRLVRRGTDSGSASSASANRA